MASVIEKKLLHAMMLEVLLKDRALSLDIFQTIIKEDPRFLDSFISLKTAESESDVVNIESGRSATLTQQPTPTMEGIDDDELDFWVDKHFEEFEDVFKALA